MTTDALSALGEALGDRMTTDVEELDARSHDTWPVATVWAKLDRHPHRPDAVAFASTISDVVDIVRAAARTSTPLTPWGLGSSVTGQPLPARGGLVIDLSRLTGDPELDEVDHTVTVLAGTRGSDLEAWLAERGWTLNHFPQSLPRSTVGGWVATRATGQYSSRYGGMETLLIACRVVMPDGSLVWLGQRPRAAMGPDLKQLMLGSEGTIGVVVEVTLKVFREAEARHLDAFELPTLGDGLDALRAISQSGLRPMLVRLYDRDEAAHAAPEHSTAGSLLFLGSEGMASVAAAEQAAARGIVESFGGVDIGSGAVEAWLARRFDFSAVEALLAEPGGYAETVEVANLWSRMPGMYLALKEALAPYADEVLGHFSHIYEQGTSLYVILMGRAPDDAAALARLEAIWSTAMEVVIAHDGEVSHHHGGGMARQAWVRRSLGTGYPVLEAVKNALDPQGIFNPGKLGF